MTNSGATLIRGLRKVLNGLQHTDRFVDDIVVHTKSWEEHQSELNTLFQRLQEANLTARPSKCVIAATKIEFIGHKLCSGTKGLHEENVVKIKCSPRPQTKKEVRSFLGLTGYYREFIPNYAAIALPLTDLTKKGMPNKVEWRDAQER